MNSKQFLNILLVVAVVGAVGFFLNKNRQSSWKDASGGGGDVVLGEFDVNNVVGLKIHDADGVLELARINDAWVCKSRGGYPAKYTTIADFVRKVGELKVIQKQPIGPTALTRMEVNDPGSEEGAGTLVELQDADGKALKSLVLGKEVMKKGEASSPFGGNGYAVGRWILDPADKETIMTVDETFTDAKSGAADWLKKDFFKITKLKSIAVTSPTNDFSWAVNRKQENGDWMLAGLKQDEAVETNKLSAIGNPLNSPSFQDVIVDKKDADLGLDKAVSVKLTTFEGFTYDVKIGNQTTNDDYHIQIKVAGTFTENRTAPKDEKEEDKKKADEEFAANLKKLKEKLGAEQAYGDWTYSVSKWTVDSFFKNRSEFIAEKKEEAPAVLKPSAPTPLLQIPKPAKPAPKPAAKIEVPKAAPKPAPAKPEVKKTEAPKPAVAKPAAKKPEAAKPAPTKETPKPAPKAEPKKPAAKPKAEETKSDN